MIAFKLLYKELDFEITVLISKRKNNILMKEVSPLNLPLLVLNLPLFIRAKLRLTTRKFTAAVFLQERRSF